MSQIAGVTTAHVVSVNDQDGEGKIKIRYDRLQGKTEADGVPIATLMTGGKRGSWFMPEPGDEVLVAFDHGDVNHPFVVGFLWNGDQKPPTDDGIDAHTRRLRSVKNHVLEFDDNDNKEKVHIKTHGGHEVTLDDTPGSANVTIKTSGGHKLTLDDTSGSASVTIKTTGGQTISMTDMPAAITVTTTAQNQVSISDAPPGITISAPAGTLSVTCLEATVTASATATITAPMLTINAPMTVFSGVVQIPTLISQMVVSTAYTPGIGNLMGL
jgi:uncharacterized protein involved in type VI secretion and phage assembly